MVLMEISHSHLNVCHWVFCEFYADIWVFLEVIVFLKRFVKFKEIRNIKDEVKF